MRLDMKIKRYRINQNFYGATVPGPEVFYNEQDVLKVIKAYNKFIEELAELLDESMETIEQQVHTEYFPVELHRKSKLAVYKARKK